MFVDVVIDDRARNRMLSEMNLFVRILKLTTRYYVRCCCICY